MRILWATDGSEPATRAGAMIARGFSPREDTVVVLAVQPEDPLPWLETSVLGTGHAIDEARRQALLTVLRKAVLSLGWPRDRVSHRLEVGDPARTIIAVAKQLAADLLVIGPRGRPHGAELVGPTAAELLVHAPCAVLICRSDAPWGAVLLATDGSASARAPEAALARLPLGDARVRVVCVSGGKAPVDARPAEALFLEEAMAERIAAEAVDRLRQHGLPAETVAASGRPADGILDAAREAQADLIVLGTHGRSGWRRAVLGSVANEVVRLASGSVLIAPAPGTKAGNAAMPASTLENQT